MTDKDNDTRNELEKEFGLLVQWAKENNKDSQIQKIIPLLDEQDLPEEYKRSFRFFQSLDGNSKELLWRLTFNPGLHKKFIKSKASYKKKTIYR